VALEWVLPLVINRPRVDEVPLPATLVTERAPPVLGFLLILDSDGALAGLSKIVIPRGLERDRLETVNFWVDC
jgi:hypothetical protein